MRLRRGRLTSTPAAHESNANTIEPHPHLAVVPDTTKLQVIEGYSDERGRRRHWKCLRFSVCLGSNSGEGGGYPAGWRQKKSSDVSDTQNKEETGQGSSPDTYSDEDRGLRPEAPPPQVLRRTQPHSNAQHTVHIPKR